MSVFHVFYLATDNKENFEQLKRVIIDIIPTISSGIAKGRPQITEDTDVLLNIWCEYFSIRIKNGGQSVKFRSEDYGVNFQYQFWFDANTITVGWFEEILSFVGKIIKACDGDCVLESNGETPLVMRKKNRIIVDGRKLNDKQILSFIEGGLEYQEGHLESV